MPRAPNEATTYAGFGEDDQSGQNQASQDFVDGSGPIFSMYMKLATEEDAKIAENWQADAKGILIFTGLFSAAVASLISVSIQDIRPNLQDTSNFYLANIYQTVANPNISTSLPASPPPFSPPNYAVWVNSLWFMSLVVSLTCALLATLLQQWARRYLEVTQSRYSPHKRARVRAFFAEGVDKSLLPWAIEILPALLHISLFLFFAGLVVFLCNVNITAFKLVLSWVGICTALYGCITLVPSFHLASDSPYYTPLSSSMWLIALGIRYAVFRVRRWSYLLVGIRPRPRRPIPYITHFLEIRDFYHKHFLQGMQRTAEELAALVTRPGTDTRAFMWTFDRLDEDHELERFFSGIPGFRSSRVVRDPLSDLTGEEKKKLSGTLAEFIERTFSSKLLPEPVKIRRAIICTKALDTVEFPEVPSAYRGILRNILFGGYEGLRTADFGSAMRGWGDSGDQDIALLARATVFYILVTQRRDDSWFILASSELGVGEYSLRNYAARGDSLSLAILIHVTRERFNLPIPEHHWLWSKISDVLVEASKFKVEDTSPELQHEFCTLWNQIVIKVQSQDVDINTSMVTQYILRPIRNVYIGLHRNTDSAPKRFSPSTPDWEDVLAQPSSYPECDVAGHIHDHWRSAPTSFSRTAALALGSLQAASPNSLSSSGPFPLLVVESLMPVPPLDNPYPILRTTIEDLRIPDPVTASLIQGGTDTSTGTVPISAPEPSASTPPASMISTSPGAIAVRHIADHRSVLDVPSLHPPTQVLDDMPLTESQPPPLVPGSPGPSRLRLSSTPDSGAVVEGEGSAKAALHEEKVALDLPLAIREDIMASPDLPPRLPSPSSVTQAAIAGPSWRSLGADHTGDHAPHPSHGQYDVV